MCVHTGQKEQVGVGNGSCDAAGVGARPCLLFLFQVGALDKQLELALLL